MSAKRLIGLLFFLIFEVCIHRADAQDVVRIVSLEWPPFSGENLKGKGRSLSLIKKVFAEAGLKVEYEIVPWNRGLNLFVAGKFDALAPEYYDDLAQDRCNYSDPIQTSPLGFISLKTSDEQMYTWHVLSDLKDYRIGTVNGYLNTPAFDELVRKKILTIEPVVNDETNILKVGMGRIPLAVIDKNVLEYLLETAPRLKGLDSVIKFNEKILEDKKIYICFQKTPRGEELRSIFNRYYEQERKIDSSVEVTSPTYSVVAQFQYEAEQYLP